MNIIGEFADYAQLQELMRLRADKVNLHRHAIDKLARLALGTSAKYLSPQPQKRLGAANMAMLLPALGMKLIAVEDPVMMAEIQAKLARGEINERRAECAMHAVAVHIRVSRRFLRRIAKKGGARSRSKMSKKRARELARKAALTRWRKPKLVEIKPVR